MAAEAADAETPKRSAGQLRQAAEASMRIRQKALRVGSVTLLLGMVAGLPAHARTVESPGPARAIEAATFEPMIVEAFKAEYGISAENAMEQLALQDRLDSIPLEQLDPHLVEVYTNPGDQFTVEYLTTHKNGPPPDVMAEFEERAMAGYVRVTVVPASSAALRRAQRAASRVSDFEFGSRLNSRNGVLVIESTEPPSEHQKTKISDLVSAAAPDVAIEWASVPSLPIPAVGGGLELANNGCTAGFVVRNDSSGALGISTAGHCPNTAWYAGQELNFRSEGYSGSRDAQWFRKDSVNWEKKFYTSGGYRPVDSVKQHGAMNVHDWVCKHGNKTGTRCGQISDRTYCPPYVPSCNATFVIVNTSEGFDWAEPGDSGGPVYANNQAWGLVSGAWVGSDDPRGIFMPQEYMQSVGIRVAIQ